MPVCGEEQTLNNEREAKTVINRFSPDWISYLRVHVKKRHSYSGCGGLTSDARVTSRKNGKRQLT